MTNEQLNNKSDLLSLSYDELCSFVAERGLPKFRATQLFSGLHSGKRLGEITTLSLALREQLGRECIDRLPEIERNSPQTER